MRPNASKRGYGTRWQKERKEYLRLHPYCIMCAAQGKRVTATVVDHKTRHGGDYKRMWDRANWQSLCAAHHNSAKQKEDKRGYSSQVDITGWPVDKNHPANRA